MGKYVLSRKADSDLEEITRTSEQEWGDRRTETYLHGLNETFERLAAFPDMGRRARGLRPGLLLLSSGRHTIFYTKTINGILIVRILHERMDFPRHH